MEWDVFKIDGTQVPWPPVKGSFNVSVTDVANASTSEAGTTIREVVRSGVHVVTASFSMPAPAMRTLAGMVLRDSMTVTVWTPDKGESSFACWLSSGFKPTLKNAAGPISGDQSTWTVGLEFTEF